MKMDKASDHVGDIIGGHTRGKEYIAGLAKSGVRDAEAFARAGFTPGMTFEEFSRSVLRFESLTNEPRQHIPASLVIQLLHLFALAASALDVVKKSVFYGKPLDTAALRLIVQDEAERCLMLALLSLNTPLDKTVPLGAPELIAAGAVPNMRALHALLGYCTEAGEIAEALRESLITDKPLDRVNIDEEFADGDWYKAVWFDVTAQTQGVTLQRVSDKLTTRYGDKPYSDKAALERNLDAERAELEGIRKEASDRAFGQPHHGHHDGE
jgi:hypothetical protein